MNNKKRNIKILGATNMILLGLFFAGAHVAHAGVYADVSTKVYSKDVFAVEVQLDTEGKKINTLDGKVSFSSKKNNFKIVDVIVSNSVLTLWPRTPSILGATNTIDFTGGSPNGFSGSNLHLFTVFLQSNEVGDLAVSSAGSVGYMADGIGSKFNLSSSSKKISIHKSLPVPLNAVTAIISSDTTAPLPFSIEVLQDPELYSGMKFISFETSDAASGVAYYEVKEGDHDPVRTGSMYTLQDQSKPEDVVVTAYDKAGNAQSQTMVITKEKNTHNTLSIIVFVAILISLLVGFIFLGKKIISRIKKNEK